MRIILQRVTHARVEVEGVITGQIGPGLLALVGIAAEDTTATLRAMAEKILHLRIHPDEAGRMNRSLLESGGGLLLISQFTLFADCRKGRRPNFLGAAPPAQAAAQFDEFCELCATLGPPPQRGIFQAHMLVHLCNDGPVTIHLDSAH